jgi:hypothetical protein
MDDKEKSMIDEHQHFMKKILKAMISTFVIFLFSIYGILPFPRFASFSRPWQNAWKRLFPRHLSIAC